MPGAAEVCDLDVEEIEALACALTARLAEGGHVITAPQIGAPLRVLALRNGARIEVLVNPRISKHSEVIDDIETCRSGQARSSKRAVVVDFEAQSIHGGHLSGRCSGASARALQHGIDHLDGILPNHKA